MSFDITNEPEYLRDLQSYYSEQLNVIETLLIEETEWNDSIPARYTFNYLVPFTSLKSILVLFDNNNTSRDSSKGVDKNTNEDTDDEDNSGGSAGESGD